MKTINNFKNLEIKHLNKIIGGNVVSNQNVATMEADSEVAVEEIEVAIESWTLDKA